MQLFNLVKIGRFFHLSQKCWKFNTTTALLAPPPKTQQRKKFKKKETRNTNRESAKQILIGQWARRITGERTEDIGGRNVSTLAASK
jgi:hypothetical protein